MIFQHDYLRCWRWWWAVSVAIACVAGPYAWWLEQHWYHFASPMRYTLGTISGLIVSVLIIWTLGIAPWLSASDTKPGRSMAPKTLLSDLRLAVWAPFVVLVSCALWLDIRPIILDWMATGELELAINPIVLASGSIAITFSMIYGWLMSVKLAGRIRITTKERCCCYECGYDLRVMTTGRCPECGHFITD